MGLIISDPLALSQNEYQKELHLGCFKKKEYMSEYMKNWMLDHPRNSYK